MEKKKKLKIKIYIIIGFLITAVNLINGIDIGAPNDILKQEDTINDLKIPIQSSLWEVDYIHIDNNWSVAANDLDWVQGGDGSPSNPYIIENVKIDAQGSGSGILVENSNDFFIIRNCTLYNSGTSSDNAGITLRYVKNSKLLNNNCSFNRFGIVLYEGCISNQIIDNIVKNNSHSGIYVYEGIDSTISGNTAEFNDEFGIWIRYCNYDTIQQNYANKNYKNGIFLQFSNSSDIIGNELSENIDEHGIKLDNSNNNLLENNTMNKNKENGIFLAGTEGCHYNVINGNVARENGNDGITVEKSDNNWFKNNIVANSHFNGIFILDSHYNVFDGTVGMDNGHNAICLVDCNFSIVKNTFGKGNSHNGIYLRNSNETLISGNELIESRYNGITLDDTCIKNSIENNIVYNNPEDGISLLDDSNNNNATGNIIKNNTLYGVTLHPATFDNLFYENFFIENTINAYDDTANTNYWNTSAIGNYWDNYTGIDSNDDGIGETPHLVSPIASLIYDYLPICDNKTPVIIVNSPSNNDIFGYSAPSFNITVIDDYPFSMWYNLGEGTENHTFTKNGPINQVAWEALPSGDFKLRFYAMDKPGYVGFAEVNLSKDILNPQIFILTPIVNQEFGKTAPSFNITIDEDNLDSTWYTIDGGSPNITFTGLSGVIDQSVWSSMPDGLIIITFYANDTLRNLGFNSTTIIKNIPESRDYDFLIGILLGAGISSIALVIVIVLILKKKAGKLN